MTVSYVGPIVATLHSLLGEGYPFITLNPLILRSHLFQMNWLCSVKKMLYK